MLKYSVLIEEVTIESRILEGGERWRLFHYLTKSIPRIQNSKCKSPEAEHTC